jgi:23S rRNA A2030 N6-methylase RlmJ
MAYDHHLKAGNQGDCVKHPPLIAALDEVLNPQHESSTAQGPFHYLDAFTGHAWHPLLDGKEYGWRNGIGQLALAGLPNHAPLSVAIWWNLWHAAPEWSRTNAAGYPGSAWIAADRCRNAKRSVNLELYDHSEEVRRDLERAFPASHAIQDVSLNSCLIGQSLELSAANQKHIAAADFVFIDPPGWQKKEHPEYPKWEDILDHVLKPRAKNHPTLMWMPSAGNNGVFSGGQPNGELKDAAYIGYRWSAVRWKTNGPGTACILVYNSSEDPIRKAVECIVGIAGNGWVYEHSK